MIWRRSTSDAAARISLTSAPSSSAPTSRSERVAAGDSFGFTDVAESVAVTNDGNIVVTGLVVDSFDGYGVAGLSPQDIGPSGP